MLLLHDTHINLPISIFNRELGHGFVNEFTLATDNSDMARVGRSARISNFTMSAGDRMTLTTARHQ